MLSIGDWLPDRGKHGQERLWRKAGQAVDIFGVRGLIYNNTKRYNRVIGPGRFRNTNGRIVVRRWESYFAMEKFWVTCEMSGLTLMGEARLVGVDWQLTFGS